MSGSTHADRIFLDVIVRSQARGAPLGIYSVCSAHPAVLRAALAHARRNDTPLLIESTCNQVNQYGGYTGMTPVDFAGYVRALARAADFPPERVILGGDHLGPSVWQNQPAEAAMADARTLVRDCVLAGYTKIHLDASMKCADDPAEPPLDVRVAAARAAEMAAAAEAAHRQAPLGQPPPRYVIGTEVPTPGGMQAHDDGVHVSAVPQVEATIEVTEQAFLTRGLARAWERVIAVVVQPGVEFGDQVVHPYQRAPAQTLVRFIEGYAGLVYEAHSTDYQTRDALCQMVHDHFAILKVGPALTFAFREAIFALAHIEEALYAGSEAVTLSGMQEALEKAMLDDPTHWRKYYPGDAATQRLARQYSLSDRSRYYWPAPAVQAALARLLDNLGRAPIPPALLSQYLPVQHARVRAGALAADADMLIQDKIEDVLADYACACGYEAPA